MTLERLQTLVTRREARLGVVGLGYVGLAVAAEFARVGFQVVGVDVDQDRVTTIRAGRSPIQGKEPELEDVIAEVVEAGRFCATGDYAALSDADIVLIAVDTPVGPDHRPRYEALKSAACSLAPVLKDGALVVVESTVGPGTCRRVVAPLLPHARDGGRRVHLGVCPERVMPGKLLRNLRTMSRVCGSDTPEAASVMATLYRTITSGEVETTDSVTAELVKTAENAYRDVQIAFANEVALICEANGADVWKVRELVNKSPERNMHRPGVGVGGHCIPKDPWLLAYSADPERSRLIQAARAVNDGMPQHLAEMTERALIDAGVTPRDAAVAVLGYAYLEDSDDTRNSPSACLVDRLNRIVRRVVVHDPWVEGYGGDVLEIVAGCDAVILAVAHSAYRELNLSALARRMRHRVLIDGRAVFSARAAASAGLAYVGVGRVR